MGKKILHGREWDNLLKISGMSAWEICFLLFIVSGVSDLQNKQSLENDRMSHRFTEKSVKKVFLFFTGLRRLSTVLFRQRPRRGR